MNANPFMSFPGISPEEMAFLQQGTADLNEEQKQTFFLVYSSRRKSPQDMLLFCILGFFIAGIQRFIIGQIGMGVLYFCTWGLCGIGTIVDIVNSRSLAIEHNQKMAYESYQIAKMRNY